MGSLLVAGAKPVDIIKQYMARGDSPTRGRELNIHFGHPARDGFIGQISMLGDMIPVMAGIPPARRVHEHNPVRRAFVGDAALSPRALSGAVDFPTTQHLPLAC